MLIITHTRGKGKEISPYELLLRNSHELLWRKLSEYTIIHLGVVRVKVWFPELKLASTLKLDRCSSVDSVISYIARKKKITSPHCGLFLERHGESGVWLENNTPLWLYDIQASDVLEYKPRPAYSSTVVSIRAFIVEQKVFKSTVFDKMLKISDLVALFQVQFGLVKDSSYYGFNLLTPEANEIWLEEESTLSSYLVHNMSVVEYKKKPIIVLEPVVQRPKVAKTCVLHQNISVSEAVSIMGKWLKISPTNDLGQFEGHGIYYQQQNMWLENDSHIGVYPFKSNDVVALGCTTDSQDSLLQQTDFCARVIFAAPPGKNFVKVNKLPSLPGEVPVFKVSNVLHLSNFTSPTPASLTGGVVGDITISNYRLTFSALQSPEVEVEIPVASIAKIEKKGKNKNEIFHGYFLDILCKDNRLVRFYWPHHDDSRKKLFHSLKMLTFPGDQHKLFAFFYEEEFSFDGWGLLNFEAEYQRQKISSKLWRVSLINANFQMCDTYPPLLAVPAKITDEQLKAVFEFRSKGRIPVMTWQHPYNGTSLSRCSQPLSGIRVTRCPEDEALIREIGFASQPLYVDKLEKNLYVLDCRPKANAMGNRAKGAGYEDTTTSYPNCILEFLNIGNIHVMRESHEKLLEICLQAVGGAPGGGWSGSGPSDWLSAVASTKWLEHIGTIMEATGRVIDCIHNQEVSVLLHCSDGWDRTAQVASLALLLLDPFHRTLRGFAILIEKEWLSFGHKFAQRHGFGDSKHLDERSPVFLQFLDCVWQMTQQFPYAFEFNEAFLLAILTHLHSCRFGTFLFNSYSERVLHNVREKTSSLWSMLLSPSYVHEYVNLFYEPHDYVLIPNTSPRYFQLWHRAHLSWYCAIPPSVDHKVRQYTQNQAITIEKLTRQIEELKYLLDPTRPRPTETKSVLQVDSKLTASEPGRGVFARNLRAALLSKRMPSGTLSSSAQLPSPRASPRDPSFPLGNPQFSRSISSGLSSLDSGVDSLMSSGGALASASSVELTNNILRGDSPFSGFRSGYEGYSSNEDENSDEDNGDDSSSNASNDNDSFSSSYENSMPNHFQMQNLSPNGRSPSIGSSRRHLNYHVSNSPHASTAYTPTSPQGRTSTRSPSPTLTSSSSSASSNNSTTTTVATSSATLRMPTSLTRSVSPSSASNSVFVAGRVSKPPSKTASSPNISISVPDSLYDINSPRSNSTSSATSPLSSPPPTLSVTPSSPRFLRSAMTLTKPSELPLVDDTPLVPLSPTHNNTNVATYIANVSRDTNLSPRARGTTIYTNAASVTNVANYISHNYSLSDPISPAAQLLPRPQSTTPPAATSPSSTLSPSPFPSPSTSPSPSPSLSPSPDPTQEEIKWQQVRRTPSSRSLHFLDQSKRLLPPNSNPLRFSTS